MTSIARAVLAVALAALAGCAAAPPVGGPRVAWATGPVKSACEQAGRAAASDRLCGCIQAVANATIPSRGDQTRAARFFDDPNEAQVIRQSNRPGDEAYWRRYRAFVDAAETTCA